MSQDLRDVLGLNFSFEIDRREKLSYEAFDNEYRKKQRPVVMSGLLDDWSAMTKWTPAYFRETFRSKTIMRNGEALNIGELFYSFENIPTGERPRYVNALMILKQFAELAPDIAPDVPLVLPNRLRSRWMLPVSRSVDRQGSPELLLAGRHAPFALHYDLAHMMGFITQIYGVKDLIFFPPSETEYLYPCDAPGSRNLSLIGDVFEPNFEQFPLLKRARAALVTIGPGDTLFNPAGWWHASRPRETSIAMVISTVGAENWKAFCDDTMHLTPENATWKTYIKRVYAVFGGALMSLEDELQKVELRRRGPARRSRSSVGSARAGWRSRLSP